MKRQRGYWCVLVGGLIGILGLVNVALAAKPQRCRENGVLEAGEGCDPGNPLSNPDLFPPGTTCASYDFSGGTLACLPGCQIDTSGCTNTNTCEADLATCNTNLTTCSGNLGTCTTNLANTQSQLTTCNADLGACTTSLTSTQGQLSACNTSLTHTQAILISTQDQLGNCNTSLTQTQASLDTCNTTLTTCNGDLNSCETDLSACEARPHVVGDGQVGTSFAHGLYHGPALSYTNNSNGTFTDNNTGLMWEMKDAVAGSVHNWTNVYTWNTTAGGTTPDGTVFTVFLATLNTPPCFAGYCDWRLPTAPELMSLADFGRSSLPFTSIPDANLVQNTYWTATTYSSSPSGAILVGIRSLPSVTLINKNVLGYVRAVRGGVPPSP